MKYHFGDVLRRGTTTIMFLRPGGHNPSDEPGFPLFIGVVVGHLYPESIGQVFQVRDDYWVRA